MRYTFRGTLRARLAKDFEEPLAGVSVLLYPVEETNEDRLRRNVTTATKRSFAIVSDGSIPEGGPIAQDKETDQGGEFTVVIDEEDEFREDEMGRPAVFRVDVRVEAVPGADIDVDPAVQFTLGYHQPDWRRPREELEEGWVADWEPTITKRNWCAVLEEAEVWVVCGRVTICDTEEPVGQLSVSVSDADIVQHETLGSATTDRNGRFCVYYTRADFEETPPPWGPIELIPGPDLYFTIERSGTTLLDESPSDGRQGDRENAGYCEYVDLCVDRPVPDDGDGQTPVPTYWRRVGSAFDAPFLFPGSSDFDAEGYAGRQKFALYRNITMEGSAPLYYSEPDEFVQYRFLVSENPTSNGLTAPTPTGFKPIGDRSGPYRNAFVEGVTVGEVLAYDASNQVLRPVPVPIDDTHLVGQGWLSVRDAVDDALNSELGTDLQGLRNSGHYFGWNDSDPLMRIDTRQFTDEPDVRNATAPGDPVPDAGDPVPASRRIDVEKIAIKFEARVVDASGQPIQSQPQSVVSGTTLNAVVINNNPEFAKFVNVNHEQLQDRCESLSGDVDLAYTVHHPHLDGVRVTVNRNDGASETLDDPNNEVSFGGSLVPNDIVPDPNKDLSDIRHFNNSALAILRNPDPNRDDDPILTKKCGYVARLQVRRRLHNGYTRDDWDTRGESIFCWEKGSSTP